MPSFIPPATTDDADNPLARTDYRHVYLLKTADLEHIHFAALDKLDVQDQLMVKALVDLLTTHRKIKTLGVIGARELVTKVAMAKRAYEKKIGA